MVSIEGEIIPYKTKIKPNDANGAVEKWLVQVGQDLGRIYEVDLLGRTERSTDKRRSLVLNGLPSRPLTLSIHLPSQVEAGMVESLREVCKQGVQSYANTSREKWVLEWPGQVVLVVTAVYWTREVGEAMASKEKGKLQVSQWTENTRGVICYAPVHLKGY